jgi:hypothetical protein|tara:strand:+ start:2272 stop:3339 length:1068 start_codon:yes stop_codon:yes gene_type:complete
MFIKRLYLIFYSRIIETKKNLRLFKENIYIKPLEKINRIIYSLIYAEQPKFLDEEIKSFGKLNPNKTFFVIRLTFGGGLYSNLNNALYLIIYARKNNFIPVIDYENYPNYLREKEEINGSKNSWEYFFEQPFNTKLKEVYESRNVILSNNRSQFYFNKLDYDYFFDAKFVNAKNQLSEMNDATKLIPYNKPTQEYIDEKLDYLFGNKSKVIGVSIRGTEYAIQKMAKDHYKPFDDQEAIKIIKEKISKYGYEYVYLSTEQQEYYDSFKKEFGEKLIANERRRYLQKDVIDLEFGLEKKFDRKNDRYLTGLDYIVDTEGLLRCDHIIGTLQNAFFYIIIKNYEFNKRLELVDKGLH